MTLEHSGLKLKIRIIKNEEAVPVKKTFYIRSEMDGLKLHVLLMVPEGKLQGIVQICHGMAEHKERYEPFMKKLNDFGFACVIHDHRGHGKSIRDPKDLGYFYDTEGKMIVEDAHQITLWMKKQYPELPFYLFGHSMGSLVVRCYLKNYDKDLDALVVCGSPSENPAAGAGIFLAKSACILRERQPGRFFHKLAFGGYQKRLKTGESENAWISYKEDNVRAYDEHPLDGFMFTNNGFLNLFHLMQQTYSKKGWHIEHPSLPILFIAGADDSCIGSKKQYAAAMTFLKKRGYCHVQGTLFLNRRHEILNEDGVEKVYRVILDFLSCRRI